MRTVARLLLAVALSLPAMGAAAIAVPGCAAVTAALPTAVEIATDAVAVVGFIKSAVSAYFASNPTNPSLQGTINAAIAKVEQGLITAEQALAGAASVTKGDIQAAYGSFYAAFTDLLSLLAQIGIVPQAPIAVLPAAVDGGVVAKATPAPRASFQLPLVVRIIQGQGK
jgi:hypothetical protein